MNIWPFKRKVASLEQSGFTAGMTDWHSHILPGVDDGFKTMNGSLKALRRLESLGVKKLWLTPHIMEDYPNETSALKERFAELSSQWDGNLELRLAAENMLDVVFEERLAKRDFLPIGDDGTHLLVETSYFNPPMHMDDTLEAIFQAGYFPLLAHPERYRYMEEADYRRLKEMGVKFQANYMSLVGAYGETARKKAEWLFKQGMVDVTGSDIHRLRVLENCMEMAPRKAETVQALIETARNGKI